MEVSAMLMREIRAIVLRDFTTVRSYRIKTLYDNTQ